MNHTVVVRESQGNLREFLNGFPVLIGCKCNFFLVNKLTWDQIGKVNFLKICPVTSLYGT